MTLLIFRSKQKQGPKSMSQQNQFQSISSECFGPGSRNLVGWSSGPEEDHCFFRSAGEQSRLHWLWTVKLFQNNIWGMLGSRLFKLRGSVGLDENMTCNVFLVTSSKVKATPTQNSKTISGQYLENYWAEGSLNLKGWLIMTCRWPLLFFESLDQRSRPQ